VYSIIYSFLLGRTRAPYATRSNRLYYYYYYYYFVLFRPSFALQSLLLFDRDYTRAHTHTHIRTSHSCNAAACVFTLCTHCKCLRERKYISDANYFIFFRIQPQTVFVIILLYIHSCRCDMLVVYSIRYLYVDIL